MNIWLVMLAAGVITYITRLSFIMILRNERMPGWLKRALRLVPPAVFSAIILPSLLLTGNNTENPIDIARLVAGLLAIVIAWRTKNAVLTIMIGMLALWIIQWWLLS